MRKTHTARLSNAWLRLLCATVALIMAGSLGATGLLAATSRSFSIHEQATMDAVDIALTSSVESPATLVPFETHVHEALIANHGAPCWIRAKTTMPPGAFRSTPVPDQNGWIVAPDGWSYRTTPLPTGGQAAWKTSVSLDGAVVLADQNANETIRVEAVQASNVSPDFAAQSPWDGIEAQRFEERS